MNSIDSMIAPRPLTAIELVHVAAPHLITYGVTHRALIHAGILQDDGEHEGATRFSAEEALGAIVNATTSSVGEWLADMEGDKEPRFYRKASLHEAIGKLCEATARIFLAQSADEGVAVIISQIEDRDSALLTRIIETA